MIGQHKSSVGLTCADIRRTLRSDGEAGQTAHESNHPEPASPRQGQRNPLRRRSRRFWHPRHRWRRPQLHFELPHLVAVVSAATPSVVGQIGQRQPHAPRPGVCDIKSIRAATRWPISKPSAKPRPSASCVIASRLSTCPASGPGTAADYKRMLQQSCPSAFRYARQGEGRYTPRTSMLCTARSPRLGSCTEPTDDGSAVEDVLARDPLGHARRTTHARH